MPENSIHWDDLLDALQDDECVLLLGPQAATYQGEYLRDLLAERFVLQLRQKGDASAHAGQGIPQLVKHFVEQFKNPAEALEQLGRTLRDFYGEFTAEDIPIYKEVAGLPFKYIINTSPDNLLTEVLATNDKKCRFFDFHFRKPEYNAAMSRMAVHLDEEISVDTPLVYNLLGYYERPDSLVLTDNDQLRFLEVVLQREKEATLPANITYFFTSSPIKRLRKSYVFVGFDFDEWHMRMFMHLLGRNHDYLPNSLSLQNPTLLGSETVTFFSDNFYMHFIGDSPVQFLSELKKHLQKPSMPAPVVQMELLLLYHPDDEALRQELETYLAPLRHGGLVDIWHENKILPAEPIDTTLRQHLDQARMIIPVLTANFLANDRLFTEFLPLALDRHHAGLAKVVPIVMTPCDVEHTPLYDLNTVYPKPKGRAVSQKPDRQETLVAIVNDLRAMIERMVQVKAPLTVP